MINKVTLIGNLGKDPDIRQGNSGTMASMSLATTQNWKDKQGEWQSKTEWHRVVAFGYTANAAENLKKGNQVYVEGSLQTRDWTDDGGIKRYVTEVKARLIRRLGPKDTQSDSPRSSGYPSEPSGGFDSQGGSDYGPPNTGTGDDVPF